MQKWQAKKVVGGVIIIVLLVLGLAAYLLYRNNPAFLSPFLKKLGFSQKSTIQVIQNSSAFHFTLDNKTLTETIADKVDLNLFPHTIIESTDQKQTNSYSWGDKPYSSMQVERRDPNDKVIKIYMDPTVMSENGQGKDAMKFELETLIIQGFLITPGSFVTSEEIEQARKDAGQLLKDKNFPEFVTVE